MKVNYQGCAICDSTWGNTWETIEGERRFFCCEVCALQFRELVERVKEATGWTTLDSLEISGDRGGRNCVATRGGTSFRFFIAFNSEGRTREFTPLPPPAARG